MLRRKPNRLTRLLAEIEAEHKCPPDPLLTFTISGHTVLGPVLASDLALMARYVASPELELGRNVSVWFDVKPEPRD
jgi:hypothetical protein